MFPISRPMPDGQYCTIHFSPHHRQGVPKYPFEYMNTGDQFFIPAHMLPKNSSPIRYAAFKKGREVRFLPSSGGVFVYCERVHQDVTVPEPDGEVIMPGQVIYEDAQEAKDENVFTRLFRNLTPAT